MIPQNKLNGPFHFIGIGGSGMSSLAGMALARGLQVSGSDQADGRLLERLSQQGARVFHGHQGTQVDGAGTVVISTAILDDNPELLAARRQQIPVVHRSVFLAWLMAGKQAITVAGTHGKTTCTAMIAHMLAELGLQPDCTVGGTMLGYDSSFLTGDGTWFVAEADESDGSFLNYDSWISVLTNADKDHLDYYGSEEALQEAFGQYLSKTDPEGCIVVGWDNRGSQELGRAFTGNRLAYGFRIGSDVRCLRWEAMGHQTYFEAVVESDRLDCRIPCMGRHNVENALGALAVARALDLDIRAAATALESYPGVARRMTPVYLDANFHIYDDYAHNPGKIGACIEALRNAWPAATIHVVYQPHRYSRLDTMYTETMSAFGQADKVWVIPVYSAGESTSRTDYTPEKLGKAIGRHSGVEAAAFTAGPDQAASLLDHGGESPVVLLTVGAGDVWKYSEAIGDYLNGKKEQEQGR